jgi:hypothetical protein
MSIRLLSCILILSFDSLGIVLAAFILDGIGAGLWLPSLNTAYWTFTSTGLREKVSGCRSGWSSFFVAFSPAISGLFIVSFGVLSPFYLKLVFSVLAITVYLALWKRREILSIL